MKNDTIPTGTGYPRVDFRSDEYDVLIVQKGQEVVHESVIQCPCKSSGDSPLATCVNCGGLGMVFINPLKTRMLITSTNIDYKRRLDWSDELQGTVTMTSRVNRRINVMDRVTILGADELFGEVVSLSRADDGKLFGFTSYAVKGVVDAFLFVGDGEPLQHLEQDELSWDKNCLVADFSGNTGVTLSLRYIYDPQYLVVSEPFVVRNTKIRQGRADLLTRMPVQALGKRVHRIMDTYRLDGRKLVDNSYIFEENGGHAACKI